MSYLYPWQNPCQGEGTNYWIFVEKEGERGEAGKYKKSCVAEKWKLEGKSEGEEVKAK